MKLTNLQKLLRGSEGELAHQLAESLGQWYIPSERHQVESRFTDIIKHFCNEREIGR